MPRRDDIKSILLIGSGPIVIGQACEFDYSGTQACKALKKEGYKVILVNSNPATIMTDPGFADKTYIEPLTVEFLEKIMAKERPDALLPTLGGQTALNLTFMLHEAGIIEKYGIDVLGAGIDSIKVAEDRELFKKAMDEIGLKSPKSVAISNMKEAGDALKYIGTPCIIRSSFTLGGTGGAVCYNRSEYDSLVEKALQQSLISKVIIEESLAGWKEYELEVMRDGKDNCVVVCPIENFDPMGVHTGDSITVAPIMTLSDKEYQRLRNYAFDIMRKVGIACGGSNVQFAVNPADGEVRVIEMNPRVSRSSALASKATGFPIAKIASLLAVGYTLDEIPNDITRTTPSCFEPAIDYVVVKIPKWAFEKFPAVNPDLTIQMKSIGEIMAIGRTFQEALQKAVRSLEDQNGFIYAKLVNGEAPDFIRKKLAVPNRDRLAYIMLAYEKGMDTAEIHSLTLVDKWFLNQIRALVEFRLKLASGLEDQDIIAAKKLGFADFQLASLDGVSEETFRKRRKRLIKCGYNLVDTCAAEFQSYTPYYYSTYNSGEVEVDCSSSKSVMILGSGPNRIGQAIEFDYGCVHAAMALRELGYKVIMVNSNPETVSTDYDTSDYLLFEPVTFEDVVNIYETMKPLGVITQFGAQTPINLSARLEKAGCKILGTSVRSMQVASDRGRFNRFMKKLGIKQPPSGIAHNLKDALNIAAKISYPVLVRPSYVLGGRAMEICYADSEVARYVDEACQASPGQAILIDSFLEDAREIDVDAICDGKEVCIGGILEHVQFAGVHSGDSSMCLPPFDLDMKALKQIREITENILLELGIIGLANLQLALKGSQVYVIEVNPRSSRTVPFVSKSTNVPLAKVATKVIMGRKLKDLAVKAAVPRGLSFVKESVLPFDKLAPVDIILGPEMRSTGEVMGIGRGFAQAYAKSQIAAGFKLSKKGLAFVSLKDADKKFAPEIVSRLKSLGFSVVSTRGTARALAEKGLAVEVINKVSEGRPNMMDCLLDGKVSLVINTPTGKGALTDEGRIRALAVRMKVPVVTTIQTAFAMLDAIRSYQQDDFDVRPLQEIFRPGRAKRAPPFHLADLRHN